MTKSPKPFSELSRDEKINQARAAIERLQHPHNRYSIECMKAVERWRETLRSLGAEQP